MKLKLSSSISIRLRTDITSLGEIDTIMSEEKAGLIVMGTATKTKLEEIILGSSALTVCKHTDYPVLLVPKKAVAVAIRHIAFACDLK